MRALLVVEEGFLDRHVGVLRVIAHYRALLEVAGYEVVFASPVDGRLRRYSDAAHDIVSRTLARPRTGADQVWWRSGEPWATPKAGATVAEVHDVLTLGDEVDPDDVDVSVVTCPWLGDLLPASARFTHGIAYDLAPNLAVLQVLDFGVPTMASEFAGQHHRGYELYSRNVETVVCISESTRDDLVRFYPWCADRVVVDIPFVPLPDEANAGGQPGDRPAVLLVNALDPRKGIATVVEMLVRHPDREELDVVVVGRERMAADQLRGLMARTEDAGIRVAWYRSASDALLHRLYRETDVLLFPSVYEGLGLPALEAQSLGQPVVTTRWSSCGEVNLNPALAVDALEPGALRAALDRALDQTSGDVLRGGELRRATSRWLATRAGAGGPFLVSLAADRRGSVR